MAKKPDWRQPSLFPTDPVEPEPEDNTTSKRSGDTHALQNDGSRTTERPDGVARAAPEGTQAPFDGGALRQGAQAKSRSLDGPALTGEAGQQPEPDRQRSAGNGSQGNGGFAQRISAERGRDAFPRRGHAVPPPSHVARLRA